MDARLGDVQGPMTMRLGSREELHTGSVEGDATMLSVKVDKDKVDSAGENVEGDDATGHDLEGEAFLEEAHADEQHTEDHHGDDVHRQTVDEVSDETGPTGEHKQTEHHRLPEGVLPIGNVMTDGHHTEEGGYDAKDEQTPAETLQHHGVRARGCLGRMDMRQA